MAILKTKDARKLSEKDIEKKINELRLELTKERANIAIGASAISPGRIKETRRAIARILTVKNEMKNKSLKQKDGRTAFIRRNKPLIHNPSEIKGDKGKQK